MLCLGSKLKFKKPDPNERAAMFGRMHSICKNIRVKHFEQFRYAAVESSCHLSLPKKTQGRLTRSEYRATSCRRQGMDISIQNNSAFKISIYLAKESDDVALSRIPALSRLTRHILGNVDDVLTKPIGPVDDALTKPFDPFNGAYDDSTKPVDPVNDVLTKPIGSVNDASTKQ